MIWYDWGHRPDDVIGPNAPEADRRIHTPNDVSRTCLPVNMAEKIQCLRAVASAVRAPNTAVGSETRRSALLPNPLDTRVRAFAYRPGSCWTTWKSIPRKGSLTGRWVFCLLAHFLFYVIDAPLDVPVDVNNVQFIRFIEVLRKKHNLTKKNWLFAIFHRTYVYIII